MPNPYVVRVDRNAFWNQYRSTPVPALQMRRPPHLIESSLYRDRWPSTGPYQGVSFPPFASDPEQEIPPNPIQEPVYGLPTAPSDVDIQGLGVAGEPNGWFIVGAASAAVATVHGYRRNNGSVGWAIAWGLGGWILPIIVPVIAIAQGFGEPSGGGFGSASPAWTFWISGPHPDGPGSQIFVYDKNDGSRHPDFWGKGSFSSKVAAYRWGVDQGFTPEKSPLVLIREGRGGA